MIICLVGIVHKFDLLPYYLHHYRQLGVDRFVIACDPAALDPSGELAAFLQSQADVTATDLPKSFRRSQLVGFIEEELRRTFARSDDWVIPADLDELNQYPAPLARLVVQLQSEGSTHMMGTLRDRIAPDGSLAPLLPFDQKISIWDQYPWEADVTGKIAKGWTDKVLLARGDLELSVGHHFPRYRDSARPATQLGIAHHFKWRFELEQMLSWRIENEQRARMPWQEDSVCLSEYFRSRRKLDVSELGATPGWRP